MSQFNRQVQVYVRDADNYPVVGANIKFREDGVDRGGVDNSNGQATYTLLNEKGIVEVSFEYNGDHDTKRLALEQQDWTFILPDVHVVPTWRRIMEKHFPAVIGVVFILIATILAFAFSNPSALQTHIILAVFALGGGAFGSEISGMIKADISLGSKLVVGATGAAAIFVVLYFAVPAGS
jgi:hypothetical protein